jgi:hypothetical protein
MDVSDPAIIIKYVFLSLYIRAAYIGAFVRSTRMCVPKQSLPHSKLLMVVRDMHGSQCDYDL